MKRELSCLIAAACLAQNPPAPSLLSRGLLPDLGTRPPEKLFRADIGALTGYDTGALTTEFDRGAGPFQEVEGGVAARRRTSRADIRLDYRFGLRHHTRIERLDRSNHALSLDARFRLSRRWAIQLRDTAASSSFGASFPEPADALGPGFFIDGGPEVFHSRTVANTALGDLVFSPSARTSVSIGGDGFVVRRQYHGLSDVSGWRARADLARRYARNKTLTFSYSFTHFDYSLAFGGADYAVYAVGHSLRLGKRSELDLLAGAGHLRSAGVRRVELDPEIARLFGTSRGAEIFRVRTWTPHVLASWTQGVGSGQVRAQFSRWVSDGGGLSGLTRQNQGTLTLAAPPADGWRLAAGLSARTFRSLDTLLFDSTTATAGFTLARRLNRRAEAVLRYHYAFYNFNRGLLHLFHRHQAAAGVVIHFQDLPNR